jgi:carboxymethylenebutenolidase
MGQYVDIELDGGSIRAFVEHPPSGKGPVVVVLHEVFGLNADMRASCRELADHGFLAVVPELFWRQERGVDLSPRTPSDIDKAIALYEIYDRDQGAEDIADVMEFAATIPGASGKVGLVGYCLGGLMAYLVSARHGADAAVAYYPGMAENYLSEADKIQSPLMIHLGGDDEYISQGAQRSVSGAVAANPAVLIHAYPGCGHAFARHSGERYDADAAALANARTWRFLKDKLIGQA